MAKCVIENVPNVWSIHYTVASAKYPVFGTTHVKALTRKEALGLFNKYLADGEITHKASIEGIKPFKAFAIESGLQRGKNGKN